MGNVCGSLTLTLTFVTRTSCRFARKPDEFAFDHVGCMIKSEKPWSGLPYLGREEYNSNTTALPKSLDWTKRLGENKGDEL